MARDEVIADSISIQGYSAWIQLTRSLRPGGGVLAAERGGLARAGQLGGGQPGPGLLDGQPGGSGEQDRAAGAVPGARDRRLVLADPSGRIASTTEDRQDCAQGSRKGQGIGTHYPYQEPCPMPNSPEAPAHSRNHPKSLVLACGPGSV